ncbi:MAG: VCBS repeat-containing protein, partial [Bacteroidales bacterium]|nr:VCBS repeat-containing protein [Bacteroidales bacterium]
MQLNESLSEQIEDLAMGKVLLGDYDADGDIDIIISGQAHSIKTLIYRNDGASVYTEIDPGFPELLFPDLSWSDFDGDSDLDIFLSGAQEINDTLFPESHLYIFQDTSFTELPANIEGVYSGCSGWADFDLDGDRDLIISGAKETPGNAWVTPTLCRIYLNDGSGQFSEIQAGIKAVFNASIDIADYDNDQYPDIITTGELYDDGGNWHRATFLYHNDGANVFSHIEAGLPALRAGDVSFGDYDDDGYTDILLTGDPLSPTNLVYIFRNNTMGNFYDIGIEIIGTEEGTIDWADYDNDGDL